MPSLVTEPRPRGSRLQTWFTETPTTRPIAASAGPARTATVMTRNLDLGAELNSILAAFGSGNQGAIVAAASTTWAA